MKTDQDKVLDQSPGVHSTWATPVGGRDLVLSSPDRRTLDLNVLRDRILTNQRAGQALPTPAERKVLVSPEGDIRLGDAHSADPALSEVHQGTFAANDARLAGERRIVDERMPSNTRFLVVDGVAGWLYRIRTELGDGFTLFLYHDGTGYQVKVVFPEVEGKYNPHHGHLFHDGLICWGEPMRVGLPRMDHAYAKSVLWANGFSVFLRTAHFPFSANNGAA